MGLSNFRNISHLNSQAHEQFYKQAFFYSEQNGGKKIPVSYQTELIQKWGKIFIDWNNVSKRRRLTANPYSHFHNLARKAANEASSDAKKRLKKKAEMKADFEERKERKRKDREQRYNERVERRAEFREKRDRYSSNKKISISDFLTKAIIWLFVGLIVLTLFVSYILPIILWFFSYAFIWVLLIVGGIFLYKRYGR